MIGKAEFIGLLNEIELSLPVSEWTADGVRIWPMVRLELYASNFGATIVNASLEASAVGRMKAVAHSLASEAVARVKDWPRSRSVRARADVLFLAYDVGAQPLIQGKRQNRLLAPYVEGAQTLGLQTNTWEMSPFGTYNIPRGTPSAYIQHRVLYRRIRGMMQPRSVGMELAGYDTYLDRLRVAGLRSRYNSRKTLERDVAYMLVLADDFGGWLKSARPRIAFIAGYGSREAAFCLACARAGITTIDIQHGVQGPLHPAYGGWASVPDAGYEIRARGFWCWDEASANAINAWAAGTRSHTAFVGGDAWPAFVDRQRETSGSSSSLASVERELKKYGPGSRHVLVTLDSSGPVIPRVVVDAMASAPGNWVFWIRAHPADQAYRLPEAREIVAKGQSRHADVGIATEAPLPSLLAFVDAHLAATWSSVVLDAAATGVSSVAVSPHAAEVYTAQVDAGLLACAADPAAIVRALRSAVERGRLPTVASRVSVVDGMRQALALSSRGGS